jgi:hypothetical protein
VVDPSDSNGSADTRGIVRRRPNSWGAAAALGLLEADAPGACDRLISAVGRRVVGQVAPLGGFRGDTREGDGDRHFAGDARVGAGAVLDRCWTGAGERDRAVGLVDRRLGAVELLVQGGAVDEEAAVLEVAGSVHVNRARACGGLAS